ncbi:MAG: hypothetical protein M1835_007086 [Candelina submexicana]|nr:MAG: hypothetical protein M1835_007086 [Candelina submexicana]
MDITQYFKPLSATIFPSRTPPTPTAAPSKAPQIPNSPPPHPIDPHPSPPTRHQPLPPELSIEPCTPTHLPSLKRINALLLPIPYPEKFYTEILSSRETARLTRIAIWHPPHPPNRKSSPTKNPKSGRISDSVPTFTPTPAETEGKVIGSIRCRLEHGGPTPPNQPSIREIYIQTLTLLAPYRGLGIGTALLDTIVQEAVTQHGATSLYAHVWEKNEEALEWYTKRGFEVGDAVEGYYRRLKPGGAKVVRRRVGVGEILRIGRGDAGKKREKEREDVDSKEAGESGGD